MGVFRYRVEIAAVEAGPFVPVETLVDTGAAYTWIPSDVLASLGWCPGIGAVSSWRTRASASAM